jgi:large subunit ribosomal protein L17
MKNLSASLIKYGSIKTTVSKAKELRKYVEKIITLAKYKNVDSARSLHFDRMIRSKLYDVRGILTKLQDIAIIMSSRNGGYISIKRIGHRANDNGVVVNVSIIGYKPSNEDKEEPSTDDEIDSIVA